MRSSRQRAAARFASSVSPRERKKRLGAAVAHEAGEALVERRLALQIQRVVGQLVDDRSDELHRVALHDGRQERVREIPEGRKRAGRTEVGVEPVALQVRGGAARRGEVEKTLVRHGADDRNRQTCSRNRSRRDAESTRRSVSRPTFT